MQARDAAGMVAAGPVEPSRASSRSQRMLRASRWPADVSFGRTIQRRMRAWKTGLTPLRERIRRKAGTETPGLRDTRKRWQMTILTLSSLSLSFSLSWRVDVVP
ncbi:hypothetical protein VTH06DRAFT_4791 [Thermothelomyces fergusii]